MGKHNGFGLLELVIAIAVMAIIAAFALPSVLGWRENAELRAVTEDIRKTMKLARSRAVKDKETVVVDFDVEWDGKWDSYWSFVDTVKDTNVWSIWGYDPGEPVLNKKQVPDAIAISFIDPVTGQPSDEWQPDVNIMYPKLLRLVLDSHNYLVEQKGVAGGLFPVNFQESKIHFKPPTKKEGVYRTFYDGTVVTAGPIDIT